MSQKTIKPQIGEPFAIYCVGAFNKNTEPYAWSSVVNSNGQDLIPHYIELCKKETNEKKKIPKLCIQMRTQKRKKNATK